MITSVKFRASMLCTVALFGAAALSARSGGVTAAASGERPAAFNGLTTPAISAQAISTALLSTIWDGQSNWTWKDDKNGDRHDRYNDHDKDHDKKGDRNDHAPAPAPEPSTLLSFAIALVIGAGALFLRRIPGVRK